MAVYLVPAHVNEATEPVDNLGGSSRSCWWRSLVLAINFAPVPNKGALVARARGDRVGRARRRSTSGSGARRTRSTTCASPARRVFWVAACAGIIVFGSLMGGDVRRPAVPAERARLLDARGRAARSCRPRCSWSWSRRARPSSSRRAARASRCSSATCSACSASSRCCCSGRRASPYWKVGLGYALIGIGVGLRRHAGVALADRLGAGQAGRHGFGHRRPAARPRRRDHAVDPRRAAHRRLRRGRDGGDRRRPNKHDHRQRPEPS